MRYFLICRPYYSPHIVRIRWAGHVAHGRGEKYIYIYIGYTKPRFLGGITGPPFHWGNKYRDLVLQVGGWMQG
jgi:hypothetical protein